MLYEARLQLSELLDRVKIPAGIEAANNKTSTATNVATNSVGDPSTATTASVAITVSSKDPASNKEKAEFNSGISENTDEFADSLEFLSAIVKIINAYKAYTSQYDSLAQQHKRTEIDTLWGEVCECHKRTYHYVKLEYCSPIPFRPLPSFIAEPPRGLCRYSNYTLLDLDRIGRDTLIGLSKAVTGCNRLCRVAGVAVSTWYVELDLAAISHLYKLRVADLTNTVEQLHSLKSALNFINDIKPKPRI